MLFFVGLAAYFTHKKRLPVHSKPIRDAGCSQRQANVTGWERPDEKYAERRAVHTLTKRYQHSRVFSEYFCSGMSHPESTSVEDTGSSETTYAAGVATLAL
jgi:hypothetical protein